MLQLKERQVIMHIASINLQLPVNTSELNSCMAGSEKTSNINYSFNEIAEKGGHDDSTCSPAVLFSSTNINVRIP